MTTTLFTNGVTLTDAAWFNDVDTNAYALTAVAGTNTITATGPTSLTAYAVGKFARFIPAVTNTAATTINISALGARNIFFNNAACIGGELVAGVPTLLYDDGTRFHIIGPTNRLDFVIPVGTLTSTIKTTDNPSSRVDWSSLSGSNFDGFSSDVGGYTGRNFIGVSIVTGVSGSVAVPAIAAIPAHVAGVAGYAKTLSTTTGAVGIFGYAESSNTNCSAFGGNTLTVDNGFAVAAYGFEIDMNITNVGSAIRGLLITGASTVEPAYAPAINIALLGVGTGARWSHALLSDDGATSAGISLGAVAASANQASQPINLYWRNGANTQTQAMSIVADASGNASVLGKNSGSILDFGSTDGGGQRQQLRLYNNQIGFFQSLGTTKQSVAGSRAGNAALASLLTILAGHGLLTDGSSA